MEEAEGEANHAIVTAAVQHVIFGNIALSKITVGSFKVALYGTMIHGNL